jgi:predicted aspartyl protease
VEALLDTGFDGDIVVPTGFVASRFHADGHLRWTLADGSSVLAAYYVGSVRLGKLGPFPALVTVLGNEALIGRGIVGHLTIVLDHGQRVIVEP